MAIRSAKRMHGNCSQISCNLWKENRSRSHASQKMSPCFKPDISLNNSSHHKKSAPIACREFDGVMHPNKVVLGFWSNVVTEKFTELSKLKREMRFRLQTLYGWRDEPSSGISFFNSFKSVTNDRTRGATIPRVVIIQEPWHDDDNAIIGADDLFQKS